MRRTNVGRMERAASVLGGAALVAFGLSRRSRGGLGTAATGAGIMLRGLTGYCPLYDSLGVDRAAPGEGASPRPGIWIERETIIDEPVDTLYAFWRDLRNLPTVVPDIESVTVESPLRSRWVVKGPAGAKVEWTAEIIEDRPGELIAWRTVDSPRVAHSGTVRFENQSGGGTLVRVTLRYDPPGGEISHKVAALFATDPGPRIEESLARLKDALALRHDQDDDRGFITQRVGT